MNTGERNLKIWSQSNGSAAPSRNDLQIIRSTACLPEFLGTNLWQTPSTTKDHVFYQQTVYFNGFSNDNSHGFNLNVECSCPAIKECIHALKIQRVYCANWSYLFILFGMENSKRFSELWSRAQAVAARLEWAGRKLAEAA